MNTLLCWFKHSSFFPFSKHFLSVSPNRFSFLIKRFTSVKTFHHDSLYFLVPFRSSSRRMATGYLLLCRGTPAGGRILTWYSSPILAVILLNMIQHFYSFEVFVNFRLLNHHCFYRDTISRKTAAQSSWVLSTHETGYPPPEDNPILLLLLLLLLFSLLLLLSLSLLLIK